MPPVDVRIMTTSQLFKAVWDASERAVVIFFGAASQQATTPSFRVFVGRWRPGPDPAAAMEFAGIFSTHVPQVTLKPASSGWAHVPPWIAIPVPDAAPFDLVLEATEEWDGPADAVLSFDPSLNFDPKRYRHNEQRVYTVFGINAPAKKGDSGVQRLLWQLEGNAGKDPGLTGGGSFIDGFIKAAKQKKGMNIGLIVGHTQVESDDGPIRIGPLARVFPAREREIGITADIRDMPYPGAARFQDQAELRGSDASFLDTRAFSHFVFSSGSYRQPHIEVRLGATGEIGAERARDIAFVHVRQNPRQWKEIAKSSFDPKANDLRRIYGTDPIPDVIATHGDEAAIVRSSKGDRLVLERLFDAVALGDIVGVIALDDSRVYYDGRKDVAFGRGIFLRFLVNRVLLMDPAQINAELGGVIDDAVSEQEQRLSMAGLRRAAASGEPSAAGEGDGSEAAQARRSFRPQSLMEILFGAMIGELQAVEQAASGDEGGDNVHTLLSRSFFRSAPHVAHALGAVGRFRRSVKGVSALSRPTRDDTFLSIAVKLTEPPPFVAEWVMGIPPGAGQVMAWEIVASCPEFVGLCAEYKLVLSNPRGPRFDYMAVLALLQNPTALRRAQRIYRDFDMVQPAASLARLLKAIAEREALPFDDLADGAQSVAHARRLLAAETDVLFKLLRLLGETAEEEDLLQPIDETVYERFAGHDRRATREEISRGIEARVDRASLQEALLSFVSIRSGESLWRLLTSLRSEDPTIAAQDILKTCALKVCAWGGLRLPPEGRGRKRAKAAVKPKADDVIFEWLSEASRSWAEQIPAKLSLADLSSNSSRRDERGFYADLRPAAIALTQLIDQARDDFEARTEQRLPPGMIDRHLSQLEALAGVALILRVREHLEQFAQDAYQDHLMDALRKRRDRVNYFRDLQNDWDRMGRSLAPDRFPIVLDDAMKHAHAFWEKLGDLIGQEIDRPFERLVPVTVDAG